MFTLAEIAESLGHPVVGDASVVLRRVAEPQAAGPDDLALAMSPAYGPALSAGAARAAILWDGADWQSFGLAGAILVPRARLAMAGITAALDAGPRVKIGVHPSAIIEDGAEIGPDCAIGPHVVIGANARVGARARIGASVTIAEDAVIGDDALIYPGVHIGARVRIGDRFVAQPGAVIGGDGFSFVTPEESGVERVRKTLGDQGELRAQSWQRIHSLGAVTIGDDVEIGANTTIDRGTVADTTIGRGTKIDNLVHIGHNNRIGADCLICGQVGMAGGSTVGDRVVLGGQCGVTDNITIGNDVVAGGATKIFTRVRDGEVILGSPAVKMETNMAMYRALRRLPRALEQLSDLRKIVMGGVQGKRDDD
ncbi:UDP-3-O-(3-hydroxymyristoyl)glucosamine N-acyltransferase [Jannaschia pohangensis]|uniref:UDP-3-O-acylglucosamine N-acyltransferase n=1 Tax=Jannaschia pohangensis TaxID=390807 RepID=A0A1I3GKH4_9RHOB|nr:UDP-3-O-(3-hydroxymyristoyl)glucosamine N-acyltransferase [Jannaschia pohangensis]SFI23701.1 UDP-3-O-[3-hydroxymyristoyl] glucosamine N-acyltransferase [Jannaschia pohangensis]